MLKKILAAALVVSSGFMASAQLPTEPVDASRDGFTPLEIKLQEPLNPGRGTISFDFVPAFNRKATGGLTIYRLAACGKVGVGVNVGADGATTPWFLINTPETGANYGVYTGFKMEKGQKYSFVLSWDESQMMMKINGSIVGKKPKSAPMPWGGVMFFGGHLDENADGVLSSLRISSESSITSLVAPAAEMPGAKVGVASPRDEKNFCSFAIESTASPLTVTVRPDNFKITAGKPYFADSSVFDPQVVTAEQDGRLVLRYPASYNNHVVISPTGANLFPDGSMESEGGLPPNWSLLDNSASLPTLGQGHEGFDVKDCLDGGQKNGKNTAGIDGHAFRTGKKSLRLSKNTPGGSLVAKSGKVSLESGREYLLTGYYNTVTQQFGSGFAMITHVSADGGKNSYSHATLMARQTRPDQWRMGYTIVKVPADWQNPSLQVLLTASGAPFEVSWDDFDLREKPVMLPTPGSAAKPGQMEPVISSEDLKKRLDSMRPNELRRTVENGVPQLRLNGELIPKFGYVGFLRPGHKDFAQAGVRLQWLYSISGDGGVNNWRGTPLWRDIGKYDFSPLEKRLEQLLSMDPGISALLYYSVTPCPAFFKTHPEACALDEKGERMPSESSFWVSYAAAAYRKEAGAMLAALAEFLKKSPYGKAVAGIHIVGGRDGQWFPHPYDGSEGNRLAFSDYLRRVYGGDAAKLRAAWGDAKAAFETVTVPRPEEYKTSPCFIDPVAPGRRRLIDGERFRNVAPVKTVSELGRIFKESMGRPVYVSMYYNDVSAGHDLGKCALKEVLESPNIDGIVGVVDYGWNRLPGFSGASVNLLDSATLHGKIALAELDYRTEYSELWDARGTAAFGPDGVGNTKGAEENLAQQRRDMGIFLSHGQGAWMYALAGNGWPHPDMMRAINEAEAASRLAAEDPRPDDRGDVAYFMDERMLDYLGQGKSSASFKLLAHQVGFAGARAPFYRSGLKVDSYLLSDLTHPKRKAYKMNVFVAAASITPDEIAWVEKNLQKDGNVLVFLFDAGRAAPGGFTANLRLLTGINAVIDESQVVTYRHAPVRLADPLADGLRYLGTETRGPAMRVDDPEATVIAYYEGSKIPAAAVKRHKDWTAIYVGAPGGVTPDFLRAAAKEAGIEPVGPSGDATYAGRGFIAIHAMSNGAKTIKWKGPCDLVDLGTGETAARSTESFTMDMKVGESRWFRKK